MTKILVCHRREDTADVAGRIFDRLVRRYGGQQILKDLNSIPLGVDCHEFLGRMVGECDVILAVIGPGWAAAEGGRSRLEDPTDFVRIEIESALSRKIPVVPLFVGGASMPSEDDVPESIRSLVYRIGVSVRPDPDFHSDMDRVVEALDAHGQAAPPLAEPAATNQPALTPPVDFDRRRDAEPESVDTNADNTLGDELAAAQRRHYANVARLEAESAQTVDPATTDSQPDVGTMADDRLAAERGRVRAEAELTTMVTRLATAEERHRAEVVRLESEAAASRATATRDAQARAEAQGDDRLTAALGWALADSEQTRADAFAVAEERHRVEVARLETEAAESRDVRDAALDRVRAAAERRRNAELAVAEKRHRAELARIEGEAAKTRDDRDSAEARAEVEAAEELTTALERAHAAAERTLAAELTVAEERHRAEIARLEAEAAETADVAAYDIDLSLSNAGTTELASPTMVEQASTILIVAEDDDQAIKSEPGIDGNIRVFADTAAIRAMQVIARERPKMVVLGSEFVSSARGAALVNAIKTDSTLANTQIRVISRAIDYLRLVRDADPLAESDEELPGEPLPADYLGTRGARRYKLRPGIEVRVDGNPTPLVDLSGTGAQLLGSTVLRLQQRVRLMLSFPPEVVRCSGLVAWVSFEPQGKSAPCYRAGVHFIDADPKTIEVLVLRNLPR